MLAFYVEDIHWNTYWWIVLPFAKTKNVARGIKLAPKKIKGNKGPIA